jgi:hypothetical protein
MLQQIMAKSISPGPLNAPFVYCIEDSIKKYRCGNRDEHHTTYINTHEGEKNPDNQPKHLLSE